jgi:hypothetical protein
MDAKTLNAFADLFRCAARMYGVELTEVEFTICKPVDQRRMLDAITDDQTRIGPAKSLGEWIL